MTQSTAKRLQPQSLLQLVLQPLNRLKLRYQKQRKTIRVLIIISLALWIGLKPQSFVSLWLTPDQQGQLLFKLEKYQLAASVFDNTRWQAYSQYAVEEFDKSALLYAQYDTQADKVAQANAMAHARRYVQARNMYQKILQQYPESQAAAHNIKIVQTIIDNVNRMSDSQKPEEGDSPKELGDKPQTGDGAEKKADQIQQELAQLSAEQLLLDPELNKMWLKQVQKNPAAFLAQKFSMQQQLQTSQTTGAQDDAL